MHWLEFLGLVPKGDHAALRFTEPDYWIVEDNASADVFFRALAHLAPPEATLYMEGSTEREVPRFLTPLQVPNPVQVAVGTIIPASDLYHVPATREVLLGLADVVRRHLVTTPAIHTVLYRGDQVLLSWYDSFAGEPMHLSTTFSEDVVRSFAAALDSPYRRQTSHAT